MIECIGVILALIAKWFKSSRYAKHRYSGFIVTLFVASYWSIYFLYNNLFWLCIYNAINICMAIRGIKNNKTLKGK